METIERLINKNGIWEATIAFTNDEALRELNSTNFKLVLLGAGIEKETQLIETLSQLYPALPVVTHYGGGSGLLYAEIYQVLMPG
ncbi:hypothetical protein [Pedobacter insulae]|nr:hypothetical protein [Pedobacter insulae]